MTKGAKIGIIVGVVIILGVGGYFLYRKLTSDGTDSNDDSVDDQKPPSNPPLPTPSVSSSDLEPTPFKNQAQGDYFRLWINRYYPADAKKLDLDKSGKFDNNTIRKAWLKYGLLYKQQVNNWNKINDLPKSFAEKFDKKDSYNFQIKSDGIVMLIPKVKSNALPNGKFKFTSKGEIIAEANTSNDGLRIGKWWDGGKQGNVSVKGKPTNINATNFFELTKKIDSIYKPDKFSSFTYRNRLDLENNFVD